MMEWIQEALDEVAAKTPRPYVIQDERTAGGWTLRHWWLASQPGGGDVIRTEVLRPDGVLLFQTVWATP